MMNVAEALTNIVREPIRTAELASVDGDRLMFSCTPPQRLMVKITSRIVEIRSDRRPEALFVARFLYETETKVLLKAAECGRKEVTCE